MIPNAGRARITAIDQEGHNFIDDVGIGDLWYFPAGIPHSIQGLKQGCVFLLVLTPFHDDAHDAFMTHRRHTWKRECFVASQGKSNDCSCSGTFVHFI